MTKQLPPPTRFMKDIKKFNNMYRMLVNGKPTLAIGMSVSERLKAFKNILSEELDEIDSIIDKVNEAEASITTHPSVIEACELELAILTELADLFGDIQVYCASEMTKFGLPLDETLAIIMDSNFSKMGVDGLPIYDERGKLQKGPNYWRPECRISEMLQKKMLG